jgi:flagellar biosynthesis protein FlhF
MQIHKYRSETISGATARIRNDLGPDAIILSSRKIGGRENNNLFEIAAIASGADSLDGSSGSYDEVRSELAGIKEMIYLLKDSEKIAEKMVMKPEIVKIYAKMLENGITGRYARGFISKGGGFDDHLPENGRKVRDAAVKAMMENVGVHRLFETGNSGRRIVALVGTTGVGKTTTIAKMAARLSLKGRKKTGLISIDNYRIGAMEQLKTYANILGIPCLPAFNRKYLGAALDRLKNMDVVLIDTAGQSQYDIKRIEELRNMMTDDFNIQTHLLLSVSMSDEEMERTAANYSLLKPKSYVFTKLDESEKCGSIINLLMKRRLPVSCLTTGQNVPDDIEDATRIKMAKLLFHGNRSKDEKTN